MAVHVTDFPRQASDFPVMTNRQCVECSSSNDGYKKDQKCDCDESCQSPAGFHSVAVSVARLSNRIFLLLR